MYVMLTKLAYKVVLFEKNCGWFTKIS